MPPSRPLVRELKDSVGEALRCVATYGEHEYEILYIRSDVAADYTADEKERVYDDLILQHVGTDFLESLFHAGSLRCTVHSFDRATVFHVVGEPYGGIFVSIDADAEVEMPAFVERLKGAVPVRA